MKQDKLTELMEAESLARATYTHWTGRAHPNSMKLAQLKSEHVKAMNELVSYQKQSGVKVKVEPVSEASPVEDLAPLPGVVAYEAGHKVKSSRPWKGGSK